MSVEDEIRKVFCDMVSNKNHNSRNIPLNRMSISGLSIGIDYEIERKLGIHSETLKEQISMFKGTAVHVYIQEIARKLGYTAEYRCYHRIPFHWHFVKFTDILLAGSIDLVNWEKKEIIELKSSDLSDRIENSHKMQLASYVKMMELKTGEHFSGIIVKFGGEDITALELDHAEVDNLWLEILKRAKICAEDLDARMETQNSFQTVSPDEQKSGNSDLYSYDRKI